MERIHPLRKLYSVIDNGDINYKIANIPEVPEIIELEVTNYCNFKCLMCKTGLEIAKRPRGFMKIDTFTKLIDEIKDYETAIKFVGLGEPLLHPEFPEFVKAAEGRGILCHLTTNGSLLNENMMNKLLESGLDSIKFSFQGVDSESYEEMRQKDEFDNLMSTIKRFYDLRGDREKPFITIGTSVTDESAERIEAFKKMCVNFADRVEVGRTTLEHIDIDRLKTDEAKARISLIKEKQSLRKVRYKCCNQVFDVITVRWNGDISACCADADGLMTLGNIAEHSIKEIWNCDRENEYRKILAARRYEDLPLCKNCYDFMGYVDSQAQSI